MENHLQIPYRLKVALECQLGLTPSLTASLQGAGGSLPSNGASVSFLRTLDLFQTTSQPQKEEVFYPHCSFPVPGKTSCQDYYDLENPSPSGQTPYNDFFNHSKTITI